MKSIVISVLALVCVAGCAIDPSTDNSGKPASSGGGHVPDIAFEPAGQAGQCSAKSTFIYNTPEGIVIVDVPAFCNPSIGPDRGDPAPDYASDPNPWEKNLNGSKVNPSLDKASK